MYFVYPKMFLIHVFLLKLLYHEKLYMNFLLRFHVGKVVTKFNIYLDVTIILLVK